MASLSQGRTAAAQCGLFTYKSVPVIFEPPCIMPLVPGDLCITLVICLPHISQHLLLKSKHFPHHFALKQYMTTVHCPPFATADACLYTIVAEEKRNLRLESGYASTITESQLIIFT